MKWCLTEDDISLSKLILGVVVISAFKWLLDTIDKGANKVRSLQLGLCIFFIFWFPFAGWEDATLRIPAEYLHDFWYVLDIVLMLFTISIAPLLLRPLKMARINNILAIVLLCASLQGCAALSALKAFVGSGDSTDKSVNVEANLAARDNKKDLVSSDTSESYANKGNVTQNGVKFKEGSLSSLIWAGGMGGIDLLIALAILVIARVLCVYFDMRHKIIAKKLQIKILQAEKKE